MGGDGSVASRAEIPGSPSVAGSGGDRKSLLTGCHEALLQAGGLLVAAPPIKE